jgi:hypothetical protein
MTQHPPSRDKHLSVAKHLRGFQVSYLSFFLYFISEGNFKTLDNLNKSTIDVVAERLNTADPQINRSHLNIEK